jgi:hypothetical protein
MIDDYIRVSRLIDASSSVNKVTVRLKIIEEIKNQLLKYDPLNPPRGDFRTVQVRQDPARLTPLRQLAEGWEGS